MNSSSLMRVTNKHIYNELRDVEIGLKKVHRIRNLMTRLDKFNSLQEHFEEIKKLFNDDSYSNSKREIDLISGYISDIEYNFCEFSSTMLPELKRQVEEKLKEE